MVKEKRAVGINSDKPEAKMARRLIEKNELQPPIDVVGLVQNYASLTITEIPIAGVDGVSIDLKVPGKKPHVVLNSNAPPTRQTFTLAHELGHLIIPWHIGTIVDHVDPLEDPESGYATIEEEANTFAAELLIPTPWVGKQLKATSDLAKLHSYICKQCKVSPIAAAIRLADELPANIVYCATDSGTVMFSGQTKGTLATTPPWNQPFDPNAYNYSSHHFVASYNQKELHWWILPEKIAITNKDSRTWRELLDNIVKSLDMSGKCATDYKSSINGVAAYANSRIKRTTGYSPESLVAACLQRYKDRNEYQGLVNHPDFLIFLQKKAEDLYAKSSSQ